MVGLLIASCSSPPRPRRVMPGPTPPTSASPAPPSTTGVAATTAPARPGGPAVRTAAAPAPGAPRPLPGTGWTTTGWQPAGLPVGGSPAVATTLLEHGGRAPIAVARFETQLLRFALYAGTADPPGAWPDRGAVPSALWPTLVATFNSGFKLSAARGGWMLAGRSAVALRPGAASMVIYQDGSATVGIWGRDAQLTPSVVAVRQNVELLVDGGAPAANISSNILPTWGFTLGGGVLVWRSAVGVDSAGRILYAAGPSLDPATLAGALIAAGALRAMELDINPAWVSLDTFSDDAGGLVATKLLPAMVPSATHFVTSSQRDFFAVFARH